MSLLQVHLFHLSGNHWAEDWWAQWTQLIITSLPSLPVGRGWALLQPFDLPGNTSAWVQDRAPPDWESWADVDQAESLAAFPHLCLLLGPPALSSETSRHQPGQSSWELDMFPVWLRWMAIPMGKMGTWGRQRGDRLCCGLSSGPVYSWKEPAGCLGWLQSRGKGSLCPLSVLTPPLHLLDCLRPWFSSICCHIHRLCVCKNKQQVTAMEKKPIFHMRERWKFWDCRKLIWYLVKCPHFSCGCRVSLTLGHPEPLCNCW